MREGCVEKSLLKYYVQNIIKSYLTFFIHMSVQKQYLFKL